jgi:hypothetical protein
MKSLMALLSTTFLFSGVSLAQFTREVSPGLEKGPSVEVSLDDVSWMKGLKPELRAAVQARHQKLYEEARRGAIQGMSIAAIEILGEIEIEQALKRVQSGERPVIANHRIPDSETLPLAEYSKRIDESLANFRKSKSIEVMADHRQNLKISHCEFAVNADRRGCMVPMMELKASQAYGGNLLGYNQSTAVCKVGMYFFFELKIDHKSDEKVRFATGVPMLYARSVAKGKWEEQSACNALDNELRDELLHKPVNIKK